MTDDIKPALTAEEWAMEKIRIAVGEVVADHGIPADEAHKTVALANFCLPDDDPRKITRADVRLLLNIHGQDDDGEDSGPEPHLAALADKLAALLPPE